MKPGVFIAIGLAIIIVVVVLILCLYVAGIFEHLEQPYYLDQMSMLNMNPIKFRYTGDERDIAGMSQRDYYLENERNCLNGVAPCYLENNDSFRDHTDYLGMPIRYRPPNPSTASVLANVTGQRQEQIALDELSLIGSY